MSSEDYTYCVKRLIDEAMTCTSNGIKYRKGGEEWSSRTVRDVLRVERWACVRFKGLSPGSGWLGCSCKLARTVLSCGEDKKTAIDTRTYLQYVHTHIHTQSCTHARMQHKCTDTHTEIHTH